MWNKKTFTVLCSLALAGSMAVPAFAAEGICGQEALIAAPYASVVAEKPTVTAGEDLFTRAELISALHQKAGSPVVNFAMQYTDVEQGAEYAEAVRWASSEKIAGGYGEDQSFVWEAVKDLPVKYREVIHLFYYEGLSTAQIAAILEQKESTVRSHLMRGREKLRSILKEGYDI